MRPVIIIESFAFLSNQCCRCCIETYVCEQSIDSKIEPPFAAKVPSCHNIAAIPERQQQDISGNDHEMRGISTNGRQPLVLWRNPNRAIQRHSGGDWWIPWTQVWYKGLPIGAKQEHTNERGKEEYCRLVSSGIRNNHRATMLLLWLFLLYWTWVNTFTSIKDTSYRIGLSLVMDEVSKQLWMGHPSQPAQNSRWVWRILDSIDANYFDLGFSEYATYASWMIQNHSDEVVLKSKRIWRRYPPWDSFGVAFQRLASPNGLCCPTPDCCLHWNSSLADTTLLDSK